MDAFGMHHRAAPPAANSQPPSRAHRQQHSFLAPRSPARAAPLAAHTRSCPCRQAWPPRGVQPAPIAAAGGRASAFLARRRGVIAAGFVGQSAPLAAEYHSRDYDWDQHAAETTPLVDAQFATAPAAVRAAAQLDAAGRPLSAVAQFLASLQDTEQPPAHNGSLRLNGDADGAPAGQAAAAGSGSHATASSCSTSCTGSGDGHADVIPTGSSSSSSSHNGDGDSSSSSSSDAGDGGSWEAFYRAHPAARFFKERRYLLLEFPCLAPPRALARVLEIGAGCGSSVLPVLRAQPRTRATVCDVSATCLRQLVDAAGHLGLDPGRMDAFVADGTDPALGRRLAAAAAADGGAADAALIMFTLSAVLPRGMLAMLRNAAAGLRPGGLLCIRDHALYDMVQLRIPPSQCAGVNLYIRGDGTQAYFYTTQDLAGLAVAAGFEVVECDYVCVVNRNRRTGQQLRRAFVHGVFKKPAGAAAAAA